MKCRLVKNVKYSWLFVLIGVAFLGLGVLLLCKGETFDDKFSGYMLCGFALVMFVIFLFIFVKQRKAFLNIENGKISSWVSFGIKCDKKMIDLVDFEMNYTFNPAQKEPTANLTLYFRDRTIFVVPGILDYENVENFLDKNIDRTPFTKQDKQRVLDNASTIKRKTKVSAWLLFSHLALFLVGLVAVIVLTEGKEIDLFNQKDWLYFNVFWAFAPYLFFATLVLAFVYADKVVQRTGYYNVLRKLVALTENLPTSPIINVLVSLDYKRRYVTYEVDNNMFDFDVCCRFDKIKVTKQGVVVKEVFADKNVQEVNSPFMILKDVTELVEKK